MSVSSEHYFRMVLFVLSNSPSMGFHPAWQSWGMSYNLHVEVRPARQSVFRQAHLSSRRIVRRPHRVRVQSIPDGKHENNNIQYPNFDYENAAADPSVSAELFGNQEVDTPAPAKPRPVHLKWRPPFLPSLVASIVIAALAPGVGCATGPLRPEFTVNTIGVMIIFLISGLSLRFNQLAAAATNVPANTFIQAFTYGLFPALFMGITSLLAGWADRRLLDGLLVLACLPTSINMCIILTQKASGNVALAIFNAVVSNALGVVVTPALVFMLMGASLSLPVGKILLKLGWKVVLPLTAGHLLQRKRRIRETFDRYRAFAGLTSELLLLCVVYCTFCDAFAKGASGMAGGGAVRLRALAVLLGIPPLYATLAAASFWTATKLLKLPAADAVAMLFCSTHKTLAFGIPLIRTMFAGNPSIGWTTAPLLVWHPMQLLIGTFASPWLKRYVKAEQATQKSEQPDPEGIPNMYNI